MEESVSLLSLNYQPLYLLYKKFPGLGLPFCIPSPTTLSSLFFQLYPVSIAIKRDRIFILFLSL